MIKIESGIPMPTGGATRDSLRKTVGLMQVGDSVLLDSKQLAYSYQCAAYHKAKIATRKQNDGKVRVWRIA